MKNSESKVKNVKQSKKKKTNKNRVAKKKTSIKKEGQVTTRVYEEQVLDTGQFPKNSINKYCQQAINLIDNDEVLPKKLINLLSKVEKRSGGRQRLIMYALIESGAHLVLGLSQVQFFLQYTSCSKNEGYKHCDRAKIEMERFKSVEYVGTNNNAVLDALISVRAKHDEKVMYEVWDEIDKHTDLAKGQRITGPLVLETLCKTLESKGIEHNSSSSDSAPESKIVEQPKQDYKAMDPRKPQYIMTMLDTLINDEQVVTSLTSGEIAILKKKLRTALKHITASLL
ncbi:hypothetical protein [Colwellia sp. 12G3]|uniref:hypothetical protein n=1 Tax=Colwellia sp. 12G3 TaxID=2058299 RepID=UPI000C3317DE|nr:hypothetical protein [Colwellia sp. 12G3]PKI12954.1 hypothetical protein CXF71_19800 [Colwellia sp. 12G3]